MVEDENPRDHALEKCEATLVGASYAPGGSREEVRAPASKAFKKDKQKLPITSDYNLRSKPHHRQFVDKGEKTVIDAQPYGTLSQIPDQVRHMNRLFNVSDADYISNLRMDKNSFGRLCFLMRELGGLVDHRYPIPVLDDSTDPIWKWFKGTTTWVTMDMRIVRAFLSHTEDAFWDSKSAAFYPVKTQVRLIMACFLLHNFIRSMMPVDPIEVMMDVESLEAMFGLGSRLSKSIQIQIWICKS
ncbi:hypothetical protein ACS0TY_014519 [Phlomoides rotata]